MKWYEYIGIFVLYGTLVQFIHWILGAIKFQDNITYLLSFLFSNLFAISAILLASVYQIQKDHKKIKKVLNELGLINEEGNMIKNLISKINEKKGEIDVRVLFVIMALLLIYLMWKGGKFSFLGL